MTNAAAAPDVPLPAAVIPGAREAAPVQAAVLVVEAHWEEELIQEAVLVFLTLIMKHTI